mgnify:CR=1 FL=1
MLARESIASIAGGVLLVGFAVILVVAMFIGTTPTAVISDAFLIVLGYFFGQATHVSDSDGDRLGRPTD